MSDPKHIQHLFLRAGFGCDPLRLDGLRQQSIESLVDGLFESSRTSKTLYHLPNPIEMRGREEASNFMVLRMVLESPRQNGELSVAWLHRLASTPAVLREQMTLFWHNHFATGVPFAYLMQEQYNTLHRHALGSFRTLLHAVAKDPAMILFLNNQQNVKDSPNENFAREVMELFTLGIGHYTELDIREAARAFTGWQVNRRGEFEFRPELHDSGSKVFRGNTGNLTGENILDLLLDDPQTARFLTRKLWKHFVSPEPDEARVEALAGQYFRSGYDTEALLRSIFTSSWFYDSAYHGRIIASPAALLVRTMRLTGTTFTDVKALVDIQHRLGQQLFSPPNVAGWPGGTYWIDAASLTYRLDLPIQILEANQRRGPLDGKVAIRPNIPRDWPVKRLAEALLPIKPAHSELTRIDRFVKIPHPKQRPMAALTSIMALPEFQLI
jgi:hypothetical protein